MYGTTCNFSHRHGAIMSIICTFVSYSCVVNGMIIMMMMNCKTTESETESLTATDHRNWRKNTEYTVTSGLPAKTRLRLSDISTVVVFEVTFIVAYRHRHSYASYTLW